MVPVLQAEMNVLSALRKIRSCENEAAALVVLEALVREKAMKQTHNVFVLEALKRAKQIMLDHEIKPFVVIDDAMAKMMTDLDPTGRAWKAGEKFFAISDGQLHGDTKKPDIPSRERGSSVG